MKIDELLEGEQTFIVKVVKDGETKYLSNVHPTGGTFSLAKDSKHAFKLTKGETSSKGWLPGVRDKMVKSGIKASDITIEKSTS